MKTCSIDENMIILTSVFGSVKQPTHHICNGRARGAKWRCQGWCQWRCQVAVPGGISEPALHHVLECYSRRGFQVSWRISAETATGTLRERRVVSSVGFRNRARHPNGTRVGPVLKVLQSQGLRGASFLKYRNGVWHRPLGGARRHIGTSAASPPGVLQPQGFSGGLVSQYRIGNWH